jgi:hypothetical protein
MHVYPRYQNCYQEFLTEIFIIVITYTVLEYNIIYYIA